MESLFGMARAQVKLWDLLLWKKVEMDTISWDYLPISTTPPYHQMCQQKLIFYNVLGTTAFPISSITWSLKKKYRVVARCWVSNPSLVMNKW